MRENHQIQVDLQTEWKSSKRGKATARLQKTLSKLEEELKAQTEMWEQKHSTSLVVHGQKSMEYMTEQWGMHQLKSKPGRKGN